LLDISFFFFYTFVIEIDDITLSITKKSVLVAGKQIGHSNGQHNIDKAKILFILAPINSFTDFVIFWVLTVLSGINRNADIKLLK